MESPAGVLEIAKPAGAATLRVFRANPARKQARSYTYRIKKGTPRLSGRAAAHRAAAPAGARPGRRLRRSGRLRLLAGALAATWPYGRGRPPRGRSHSGGRTPSLHMSGAARDRPAGLPSLLDKDRGCNFKSIVLQWGQQAATCRRAMSARLGMAVPAGRFFLPAGPAACARRQVNTGRPCGYRGGTARPGNR